MQIGGKTQQEALATLRDMTTDMSQPSVSEHTSRIEKAQRYMQANNIAALYLNAGTNLAYFTGMQWYASERLVGAILPARGDVVYIAPTFEIDSLEERKLIAGHIEGWQEHESPYALFAKLLSDIDTANGSKVAVDESTQFFIVDGFSKTLPKTIEIINGSEVTAHCRMHKSPHELALIQRAMDMTLAVHKATASMLKEGMTTTEVEAFINEAHRKVGASGSYFCIVLFGKATSFPHGVKDPQVLKANDLVLIDTGCKLHGYLSDITRTYCFGEPTSKQRQLWSSEKQAQIAAFNAATVGSTCGDVDAAARHSLEAEGLGPDYTLPGLPHRTGHGIGMDIHEWPYLVKDNPHQLAPGMCFSNEPMIVVPGEFGIRLEDHFYVTDAGPVWFTEPSKSITEPFND
ncbi:M24 family metallopeptidase [Alteromonas genovensis]|uniref:M24 family metallopeptidase n=1 Tax=Alteromonas genovensis TaxID=471225 RepID=A0A6N9TBW6_9ALTE|nr:MULTISPECIES: Xaa-Pro peptidase family protein [Alteromonas]MAI36109.1 X-Pro dipeptidase [Alteromonas sp.]NDW13942.1 M24 family metallopeptidase [Alteromonas genovensis]OUX92160.1 MAG: X-Pro dipeptidase [Alteromonas sp. TMED35]|tara:strand:- start:4647 stop:5855 length:1209 start_codon:yes stop_codon:yes gene_type:complete